LLLTGGNVAVQFGRVDLSPCADAHDGQPAVGGLALDGAHRDAQALGCFGDGHQVCHARHTSPRSGACATDRR